MKPGGLASAFGGNLAIMDIYAAQKVFGRGRRFDRIDLGVARGRHDRRSAAPRSRARSGRASRWSRRSSRGQQFEAMLRRLLDDGEHHEPVRAVHRDVHHLQLLRHRGDPAAGRDRHPARAGRHARRRSARCSSAESAVIGLVGSALGVGFGVSAGARDGRVHRRDARRGSTAIAQRAEEVATDPRLLGVALAMGIATSMRGGAACRRGTRPASTRCRRCRRGSTRCCRRARTGSAANAALVLAAVAAVCLVVGGERGRVLHGLPPGHARRAAADARAVRSWLTRAAAAAAEAGCGPSRARWPPTV